VEHDLRISIDPSTGRLTGLDRIRVQPDGTGTLDFFLSKNATGIQVNVDGEKIPFEFSDTRLRVKLPSSGLREITTVDIRYTAVFNDKAPDRPVNTENPGYGVTGTIGERGTLLLFGAGWYPHLDADLAVYRIRVEAPAGIVAVTAGRSLGHQTREEKTVSTWLIDHPVRGLSLSAGAYRIQRKQIGDVVAATYFLKNSAHLAEPYLDATARYIRMYEKLFGPYPFAKFAVVENFFPTGYGFPSYTLLGSRVLRLPFIVNTSLGHEIAHCWWGNGVYVDYRQGNWSEGLTTYVADYYYKEQASRQQAEDYRRQWLRNYASVVKPSKDFPLDRFQSRFDPVSKTIGYDKGAMVFHMLRRELGEDGFWGALREIYRQYRFKTASWDDLRKVFEHQTGRDMKPFFAQWVKRDGAPLLKIEEVCITETGSHRFVDGFIVQQPPYFEFQARLQLETDGRQISKNIRVLGEKTRFNIVSHDEPDVLTFDPDYEVFRKLHPTEIPPSINDLKASDSLTVIIVDDAAAEPNQAVETLLLSLGLKNARIVQESEIDLTSVEDSDLLLFGWPRRLEDLVRDTARFSFSGKTFNVDGKSFSDPADVFFGVFEHPSNPNRSLALLFPLSEHTVDIVSRKITHYGKYSYLVFRGGRNIMKGVWPTKSSPLMIKLSNEQPLLCKRYTGVSK
jgi:hypothetical protein